MEEATGILKAVYMGTPAFAAEILSKVHAWSGCEIQAVYTQPDRPAGRGRKLKGSEVKQFALARGLPVYQPDKLRKNEEEFARLRSLAPDVILVAAYGLILPRRVLEIPRFGCINVHASLLPKYRGAAPIQRAIMNGDPATGISIMQMDVGMDTGDVLLQRAMRIGYYDTAADLHDQLAEMGGEMLVEALQKLVSGQIRPVPQDDALATHAAKLSKDEGAVNWNQPSARVHDIIRALHPWPGAYYDWLGEGCDESVRLKLTPGMEGDPVPEGVAPGTLLGLVDDKLAIACSDRLYLVPNLCPPGKRTMDACSFCHGYLHNRATP